jgi:hypothetical protein
MRCLIRSFPSAVLPCALIAGLALSPVPGAAESATATTVCSTANEFFVADALSGIDSPCSIPAGDLMVESLYLQDASRIGGTALAIYPMFRLRTGVTDRVEVEADTPSQIAESGRAGAGLYPTTHLGFGASYTFAESDRLAVALGAEQLPPISRFATTQTQPKYGLDLSSGYRLTPRVTLQAFADDSSSSKSGFQREFPSAALGAAYGLSWATQVSVDVGTRAVARRANLQNFGNVTADQRISKKMTFDAGLGTTFNPISNAKAHYLASGLNYRL